MPSRARIVGALCAAVMLGVAGFLVWQEGVPAYQRSQPVPPVSGSEVLALPEQVHDPSPYAPSTQEWGPPGPVGLVLRGRTAQEGFTGEVSGPWYAVSARTGRYWRLEAPCLDEAGSQVWLSPRGTQVAWWCSDGLARYDTMTGETRTYPVAGRRGDAAAPALVWSPDSSRIAFGTDPVRVLDTRTGEVAALPLRARAGSAVQPAWTQDGHWVTVVTRHGIRAVQVDTGKRRWLPADVGLLRAPEWNPTGEVAGVHPQRHGDILRIVHTSDLAAPRPRVDVVDEQPEDLVIDGFWGWVSPEEVVLTGLRPEAGRIEHAMAVSLPDGTLRTYMQFPTLGENWVGISTVSLASDLVREPTRSFAEPTMPWSPGAKLALCLLLAVFPVTYYLIARRPKQRR